MVSSLEIEQLDWQPIPGCPGVSSKVLRRDSGSVAALIGYDPHAHTPGTPHPQATQHIWVISGQALIDGRWLTAGSYVQVPAGVAHPIAGGGTDGCVLLQLHVPLG